MKPTFALLALLAATPALAQTPPPSGAEAPAAGRYQLQPVEGGLARLDTATGEVAICRVDPVLMACDFAAPAPGRAAAAAPPRASAEAADEQEFDRALGRMQRLLRAFGDVAREAAPEAPAPQPNRT